MMSLCFFLTLFAFAFGRELTTCGDCCNVTVSFSLSTCAQTTLVWESPKDGLGLQCQFFQDGVFFSLPCNDKRVVSQPTVGSTLIQICKPESNFTGDVEYTLRSYVNSECTPDVCGNFTNCAACSENSACVWCSDKIQEACVSGGMFGPSVNSTTVSCSLMQWKYRQCAMAGLWILVICSAIIVFIIFLVILLVWCFIKNKKKRTDKDELHRFLE